MIICKILNLKIKRYFKIILIALEVPKEGDYIKKYLIQKCIRKKYYS